MPYNISNMLPVQLNRNVRKETYFGQIKITKNTDLAGEEYITYEKVN